MPESLLAVAIYAVGACVQGAVGFGANLLAAPLLALVSDRFVPGPIVLTSTVLNLFILRAHHISLVDQSVRAAALGQVIGAAAAGVVLALLPSSGFTVLFALVVLVAVVLSSVGVKLPSTSRVLTGAGLASGFMGTVSGIGGPPIALAYLDLSGPALRATLSRFFLVSSAVAIPILVAVGDLGLPEVRSALLLLPGAIVGFALSPRLARHLDRRTARPVVLILSASAAVILLLRTIL